MRKLILTLVALIYGALMTSLQAHANEALVRGDFRDLTLTMSKARVTQVHDAVTVSLDNGKKLRLSSIWTPWENGQEEGEAVAQAAEHLRKIISGRFVRIYQTRKADAGRENRMGHMLAHLERDDGLWVQGDMLNEGLVHVMTSENNAEQAKRMYEFEESARKAQKGLWKNPRWKVLTPDEANSFNGEFRIVEGTVYSLAMRSNVFYVNFGSDWKSDFTLSIPSTSRSQFSRAGINIQSLSGKKIRARGWMRQYNGGLIEITHPQQIELINDEPTNSEPAISELTKQNSSPAP